MKVSRNHRFGISTVWRSSRFSRATDLIGNLTKLGFNTVELEYRISNNTYEDIKMVLKKNRALSVCSVHNIFPIPEGQSYGDADAFLLSSDNREERLLALKYTVRTMRIASELGAKIVVVHLGRVPMESVKKELFQLYDSGKVDTEEHSTAMRQLMKRRQESRGKTFDMVLLSVEALVKAAEDIGITIGIENRYYFREYPNFDEFGVIFKKFGDDHIGYWHDVGHAKVQENLGIIGKNRLLDTYGKYLTGTHLHDVRGYLDHCVPGSGEVDFMYLKQYLRPETLRILEIHSRESEQDVLDSIRFLKSMGID